MKNHLFLTKLAILGMVFFSVDATAQPKPQLTPPTVTPVQIPAPNLSPQERRELEILRKEKEKLQQETEIHNLVQAEVDRSFSRTTTLINILLFLIILFPVTMVLGLWLLRGSIINTLVAEIKQELQAEIEKQAANFKQEMEQLQREYVTYFSQLQAWANSPPDVASNSVTETSEDQQFISSEVNDFIPGETQPLMAQNQYQISNLTQNEQTVAPELDNSQTQVLTIDDYLSLGNSYLAKSRYQEAIDAYNAALKIERNLPEVRYQNAKAYALRGSINPAIGNLQWAIDLDPQYKEMAQTDPAFNYIRNDQQFQQLVNQ